VRRQILLATLLAAALLSATSAQAAKAAYCDDNPARSATYLHDINARHGWYCWNWSKYYGKFDSAGDDEVAMYQSKYPGWVFEKWAGDAWHPNGDAYTVKEHVWFAYNCGGSGSCYREETAWATGTDYWFNDGLSGV
jgi:hypothetical protein